MEPAFAHLPVRQQVIADSVYREAREECPTDSCAFAPMLQTCVTQAVEEFADVRVTAHVQILVRRRVRCCIQAGTCDCGPC